MRHGSVSEDSDQAPVDLLPITVRVGIWSLGAAIGLALDLMLSGAFYGYG